MPFPTLHKIVQPNRKCSIGLAESELFLQKMAHRKTIHKKI